MSLINFPKLFGIHTYICYPHNFLGVMVPSNVYTGGEAELCSISPHLSWICLALLSVSQHLRVEKGPMATLYWLYPSLSSSGFSASLLQHTTLLFCSEMATGSLDLSPPSLFPNFFFPLSRFFSFLGIYLGCGS